MQAVSSQFNAAVQAPIYTPKPGVLISWSKEFDPAAKFFQLDHSYLDGPDLLQGEASSLSYFDKFSYSNETEYVKNFRINKKISSKPWGVIMATAEVVLDNTTRRFLPGFDPVIGEYIKRDRPIKISVGFGNEYINLFVGFTERPVNTYVARTTTLQCFDALAFLSSKRSNLDAFVDTPMEDIIEALLIEQGFNSSQFSIEAGSGIPIGYLPVKDRVVTDIFAAMCEAEGGLMFVDEQGIIRFWNRSHMLQNQESLWDFNYSNLEDIGWDSTDVVNDVLVITKPKRAAAFNKIFELAEASDNTLVPAGGSVDIFAEFKEGDENFDAISVVTPVYIENNVGSSTYSTNYNKDGSGDTGHANITLTSVYNFGNKYRMTFANSGPTPIYITGVQLFGQPARLTHVETSPQYNQTSIDEYGRNPDNGGNQIVLESELIQDAANANALGYYLMSTFTDPKARMELPNFPVPHLQLGDPVTVHIEDTETTHLCRVLGSDLFLGVNGNFTHKIFVEERPYKSYFILDSSHLDGPDVLAL